MSNTADNKVVGNNIVGDVTFNSLYTTGIYLADASNNTFYQNQTDAAWLAVNVKNSWQTDDPLRLMAKKIPTPSYYAMTNEPSTKIGEPSAKPETLPEKKAETVNPQSHEQKPVAEPAKAPEIATADGPGATHAPRSRRPRRQRRSTQYQ